MPEINVASASSGDLKSAVERIPEIAPVISVVLSPGNPQVMIRGAGGNINVDTGPNPLHGWSRGAAEYLASLMRRIGWEWTDSQMFVGLKPSERYYITESGFGELRGQPVTPEQMRENIRRAQSG